jgi:hypothetical protein
MSNCDVVAGGSLIDLAASRLALRALALRAATAVTRPNRSARLIAQSRTVCRRRCCRDLWGRRRWHANGLWRGTGLWWRRRNSRRHVRLRGLGWCRGASRFRIGVSGRRLRVVRIDLWIGTLHLKHSYRTVTCDGLACASPSGGRSPRCIARRNALAITPDLLAQAC